MILAPLIGQLCALACSMALTVNGSPNDQYSTHPVYFYGVQVGVYLDDTQKGQCADAAIERQHWQLVIAGNAPGFWPQDECPAATFNALEWGQYWGHLPRASAYILESSALGPLTSSAPVMTRRALGFKPGLVLFWR